jgi:hypothetical protein
MEDEMKKDWVKNLKAGDAVFYCGTGLTSGLKKAKVVRLTRTRVVVETMRGNEVSFMKGSGRQVGSSTWSGAYLEEPTEAAQERYAKYWRAENAKSAAQFFLREASRLNEDEAKKLHLLHRLAKSRLDPEDEE